MEEPRAAACTPCDSLCYLLGLCLEASNSGLGTAQEGKQHNATTYVCPQTSTRLLEPTTELVNPDCDFQNLLQNQPAEQQKSLQHNPASPTDA